MLGCHPTPQYDLGWRKRRLTNFFKKTSIAFMAPACRQAGLRLLKLLKPLPSRPS